MLTCRKEGKKKTIWPHVEVGNGFLWREIFRDSEVGIVWDINWIRHFCIHMFYSWMYIDYTEDDVYGGNVPI